MERDASGLSGAVKPRPLMCAPAIATGIASTTTACCRTPPRAASRRACTALAGGRSRRVRWTDTGWTRRVARATWSSTSCTSAPSRPTGPSRGASAKLPTSWPALGVTAIELMPVAEFPGERNWGYDGVALSRPRAATATPDELRRLVDAAHALGLAVILDVVYNHLGPDGNYLARSAGRTSRRGIAPPGAPALNLDGAGSRAGARFFIENALHWMRRVPRRRPPPRRHPRASRTTARAHFLAELASARARRRMPQPARR